MVYLDMGEQRIDPNKEIVFIEPVSGHKSTYRPADEGEETTKIDDNSSVHIIPNAGSKVQLGIEARRVQASTIHQPRNKSDVPDNVRGYH